MRINSKGCFLGGIRGRSLVIFQGKKVGFYKFSRNYSFGGVRWGVWRKRMGFFSFGPFFFCDMVT
jgi:hypothetical protein